MKYIVTVLIASLVSALGAYYAGYRLGSHHQFLHMIQVQGVNAAHFMNELESVGIQKTIENFTSIYEAFAPGALYAHGKFVDIENSTWKYAFFDNDIETSRKTIDQAVQYYKRNNYVSFYETYIKGADIEYDSNTIELHKEHDYFVKKGLVDVGF